MKLFALLLLCLAALSQGRVLQPSKEAIDIPVAIIQDSEPQALPLIKAEAEQQTEGQKLEEIPAKPIEAIVEAKPAEPEAKLEAEPEAEPLPEAKPEDKLEAAAPAEPEAKLEAEPEPQPEQKPKIEQPQIIEESQPAAAAVEVQPILKALPAENAAESVAEVASPEVAVAAAEIAEPQDAVQPHVRQATQATPTQTSTQQNFVQQLIQNSPIGQFLNQFNGQQQQQQPLADSAVTPAPTVPGFLNPGAAITSAQNAVQNAAQSVVNTTTQAFQGIQQFANNLGTQFQNTLSGLTGQQNAQPTTARPPGPIQSFVNNVFGGGNNATAPAAAAPAQPQGPLQGIINFLGGGNRPQNAPIAPAAPTEAPVKPQPGVDDKIEPAESVADVAEQQAESENEVRSSAEAIDDSFEEAVPSNEVIVVNDDASAADIPVDVADISVPNNSVEPLEQQQQQQQPEEPQPAQTVDAVAL